jgi:hypothetical protein
MSLEQDLMACGEYVPADLERFASLLPGAWVEQALAATGTASLRRRRLPAEQVVWLVIGLSLFRDLPIWRVVQQLGLDQGGDGDLAVPSAAVAARQRLGASPLAWLFDRLAQRWSDAPQPGPTQLGGLRSLAVDGVVWDAPDTPANRQALGAPSSQFGPGGWPQVRAVCLMDTHTHLLRAARIGGYHCGELSLARQLIEQVPDESLTVFDRAYFSACFLLDWQAAGRQRHWLMRARQPLRHEVVQQLGPHDWLVRMPVSPQARAQRPDLPAWWQARLIECQVAGQRRRFITSLLDAQRFPARQVAAHYVQRWEIELGFREIKQSLLRKAPVLRSKQPELIEQELWGLFIAYDLIRQEMAQVAAQLKLPPQRLSFQWLALAIASAMNQWPLETPGALPKHLASLRDQARAFVLPPRRHRSCPRQVKSHRPRYPEKKMPVSS